MQMKHTMLPSMLFNSVDISSLSITTGAFSASSAFDRVVLESASLFWASVCCHRITADGKTDGQTFVRNFRPENIQQAEK
jgi:hypothetical protein